MRLDDYEEPPIPPGTIGVPSPHECLVHGREVKLVRPDRGQWLNDRMASVFFADVDDLRLTRLTNEEIGMGIVLATVWDARKGIHDHRDAYDTLYRLFPQVFEEVDDRALLVTLYALDTRMPFSFRSSRPMSSKVLREAYDDQGWSGEMAIINTSITRPAPGARAWFSDETAAVAARMLF